MIDATWDGGFAEWTRALVTAYAGGEVDPRLMRLGEGDRFQAALGRYDVQSGGALVPPRMLPELRVDPLVHRPLRELCSEWPMASDSEGFPYMYDDGHSSDAPYGLQYRWEGDDDDTASTESTPKFAQVRARAKTLEAYLVVDYPLVMDAAMAFEGAIEKLAQIVYGWLLDKVIIRGNGAGQPLGILNAPGTITVSRGQANQIRDDEIGDMLSRILPGSFAQSVFLAHPTAVGQMYESIGGRGLSGGNSLSSPGGSAPLNIATRPVIFTDHCSVLGTGGDLILADLSAYQLYDRQAVTIQLSDLGPGAFSRFRTLVRAIARLDGQPGIAKPIRSAQGAATDTLSAFVMLGTP